MGEGGWVSPMFPLLLGGVHTHIHFLGLGASVLMRVNVTCDGDGARYVQLQP